MKALLFLILAERFLLAANAEFTLEQGPVWQGKNEFGIDGSTGSRIDLGQSESGPYYSVRLEGKYHFTPHHALRILIAPFSNQTAFRSNTNFQFQNTTFSAGQLLNATFMFNSYRASYIYTFNPDAEDWRFQLGLTAKIRHARIAVSDGVTSAEKRDLGFVPLIHFGIRRTLDENWALALSGDLAWAPQGRAEDLLFNVLHRIAPQWELYLGYRMLEGGADNASVYTFSWFHYAVAGLTYDF